MAKLLHILISLSFLAANIAAALPACDSEKSDLSCIQAHSSDDTLVQSGEATALDTASAQADRDQLHQECCSCDHPAVCLGCCHSHTFMAPRLRASLAMQIKFQLSANFADHSVHSAQPEADIDRPPIASAAA